LYRISFALCTTNWRMLMGGKERLPDSPMKGPIEDYDDEVRRR
jgi:hypothetical protein